MQITYVKSEADGHGGRIIRTYDVDGRLVEVEHKIGPRPGSAVDYIHVRRHRVAAGSPPQPNSAGKAGG